MCTRLFRINKIPSVKVFDRALIFQMASSLPPCVQIFSHFRNFASISHESQLISPLVFPPYILRDSRFPKVLLFIYLGTHPSQIYGLLLGQKVESAVHDLASLKVPISARLTIQCSPSHFLGKIIYFNIMKDSNSSLLLI